MINNKLTVTSSPTTIPQSPPRREATTDSKNPPEPIHTAAKKSPKWRRDRGYQTYPFGFKKKNQENKLK